MKIHIIGGSGSGKSYLANQLSNELGIKHYDLDDIQWDNNAETYGVKNSIEKRKQLLIDIINKEDWIIEGVYYKWCRESFENADKIYLLQTPIKVCRRRVVKRFIKRKIGIEKGKKDTLKSLKELIKWMEKYQNEDMHEIKKILQKYKDKVIEV